jgi:hypothetical protein
VSLSSSSVEGGSLFSAPADDTWTSINFSADDISVQAGQPLAIVLESNAPYSTGPVDGYNWYSSHQGDILLATGSMWTRDGGSDDSWTEHSGTDGYSMMFQEYVSTVPEPSAVMIGLAGAVTLVTRPRSNG